MNLIQQAVERADHLEKANKLVIPSLEPAPSLGNMSSRSFRPVPLNPSRKPLAAIALALLALAAGAALYIALAHSRDEAAAVASAFAQAGLGTAAEGQVQAVTPPNTPPNTPATTPANLPAAPTTPTAITAPLAAVPAAATPASPVGTPTDPSLEVRYTIDAWARAWSQRDVGAYLAYYGAGFAPERGATRAAWEKARRIAIERRSSILVTVSNLQLEPVSSDRVVARFTQDYAADAYRESGTPKRLVLAREGGVWRIVAESGTTTAPR